MTTFGGMLYLLLAHWWGLGNARPMGQRSSSPCELRNMSFGNILILRLVFGKDRMMLDIERQSASRLLEVLKEKQNKAEKNYNGYIIRFP